MEKQARLHLPVQVVAPPAGLVDAGELGDDELEMAVGGLARAWTPAAAAEAAARTAVPA